MSELTKKIDEMLFEIHKKRWISLSKDDPGIVFDAKAKLAAYNLIERQNQHSWKLTREGYEAVELGGFEAWEEANDLSKSEKKNSNNSKESGERQIFISHASKNSDYGNALVELLTGVGIANNKIVFTSNTAYGIPIGENIFDWLKNRINEKPHVIYLLSKEYYDSIACLNEMGAAWVVENQHTMLFTPNFDLKSYEFQNGALDPRKIGFRINNEERLTEFVESLKVTFKILPGMVLVNQKIKEFLKKVTEIESEEAAKIKSTITEPPQKAQTQKTETNNAKSEPIKNEKTAQRKSKSSSRLFSDLRAGKLKTEEVLLVYYIIETGRFKLGTGWQEPHEIENIEAWEDINELDNVLSKNYSKALKRFEMRALIEVSDFTGSGNPKEMALIDSARKELLDLPEDVESILLEVVKNNPAKEEDDFPF
ncbi:MAG: toll/interleukin-1 receptor domain-containing protein [Flavobacteriales bacterium]|nr:toll/interleukin-1 receptor domain-containing protein [Flavobacteriales bacterium]